MRNIPCEVISYKPTLVTLEGTEPASHRTLSWNPMEQEGPRFPYHWPYTHHWATLLDLDIEVPNT